MTPARFADAMTSTAQDGPSTPGFFLMSVPATVASSASSMQWLYQRMYEEAAKANQPKPAPMRDLFSVMN